MDYSSGNMVISFMETVAAFASSAWQLCLWMLHILNEAFDGGLLEVLVGGGCWLLFVLVRRWRPHPPPGKAKACFLKDPTEYKKAAVPVKARTIWHDLKSSSRTAAGQRTPVEGRTKGPLSNEAHEVQTLIAQLLSHGKPGVRHAPSTVLEQYDRLVRVCGIDLRQYLEAGKQAHSVYLCLAQCARGKACPRGVHGQATWKQRLLADMRRFRFARSLEFYSSLAMMYSNEHLPQEVLGLYEEMSCDGLAPDHNLLVAFINAAVACDAQEMVMWYFEKVKEFGPPSMRTYMTVLSVCKSRQDVTSAVHLLDDMEKIGIAPDTLVLNHVLGLCVEASHVSQAEKVLKRWRDQCDVISCNTVLKGYAQKADLAKAESMLQGMLANGPAPNIVTFNTIMDCSVRSMHCVESLGKKDRGNRHSNIQDDAATHAVSAIVKRPWELLDQLTALNLHPDRYTCSILVKGMHYAGASSDELDRVGVLLRQVGPTVLQPSLDSRTSEGKNNLRLVEVLFNTLLDICAGSHDLDRMVDIFAMMKEFQVTITNVTFGILIKAYGQAGRLGQCHEVWEGMLDANIKPTVVTFGCYLDACMRNSDASSAERIFSSMALNKVQPNGVIYTSMIRGLSSAGEPAKAFKLYRQMRKDRVQPTSASFNSILDSVARQIAEPSVLESVISDLESSDAAPDMVISAFLIRASCSAGGINHAGNINHAMTLFRQIGRRGLMCDQAAMNTLLHTCARLDRVKDCEEVFDDMCKLSMLPNSSNVAIMVKMYGRARMPDSAEAAVEAIQRDFGTRPSLQVYSSLIQALSQNKLWQRVLDVFDQMSQSGLAPDALTCTTAIQSCINLGLLDHALNLVRRTSVRLQLETLHSLLEAMKRQACLSSAAELEALIRRQTGQRGFGAR
jgi:pentatricopeptide repeat protein